MFQIVVIAMLAMKGLWKLYSSGLFSAPLVHLIFVLSIVMAKVALKDAFAMQDLVEA